MVEKDVEMLAGLREALGTLALFAAVGVVIGLGRLLNSKEELTTRLLIGRTISTAGLSMAAGAVLVWVPGLPLIGQLGVSAGLACLGTAGLERLFSKAVSGASGIVKGSGDEQS